MCADLSSLRARIRAGEALAGSFVNVGSALTAEIMGRAGFDWLVVDLEHGSGDEAALFGQLQALDASGTPALVRIDSAEPPRFSHALDQGAAGVLVPRVESAAEASLCAAACRYGGTRGVGRFNRSHDWGLDRRSLEEVDAEVVCAIQIETVAALEEVEAIAAIDGVDVLFLGPADLGHELGVGGPADDPELIAAGGLIAAAAREYGKAAGVQVAEPRQLAPYAELGFTVLGASADSNLLARGARDLAAELRDLDSGPTASQTRE